MNKIKRRIIQVTVFEFIAIIIITAGSYILTTESMSSSLMFSVINSTIAVVWNYVFNTSFEYWEAHQNKKGRSFMRRITHVCLFEIGLAVLLVPFMAWWFNTSLLQAFIADIGILVFFLVYGFSFNWLFDRIAGLPESAK